MSEKDKISLIMESYYSSAFEVGLLVEERPKHPADAVTEARGEIVEHHLDQQHEKRM